MHIDTSFDFNSEVAAGRDADTWSPTLASYHAALWSRPLPSGRMLTLEVAGRPGSLHLRHESDLGVFELSSDAFTNRLRNAPIARTIAENDMPPNLGYTIGSAIVFPRAQVDGRQTINQRKGTHPAIKDRPDLFLECLRRHYLGEESPLSDCLTRYETFFALFETFDGYVEHFILQDLTNEDGSIAFMHTFNEFRSPAVPGTRDDYVAYRLRNNDFIEARNRRIARFVHGTADRVGGSVM